MIRFENGLGVYYRCERLLGEVSCVTSLEGGEVGFGAVVLIEFLLDIVVDGGEFFLQSIDEFGNRFVGAIFDFVPLEGLEVVLNRSYITILAFVYQSLIEAICHTVVDHFLLL